ncbi:C-X-C motif chemokine 13 [Orycteropus afer afer]|uniref:C-X-C motif chemokine 13 n=1 Tax=Orycteropus afer afer TaxID=1230840 RepID=A0A8B7AGX5_ORYAF|nr:C-X-C motif chemokine 13 [Orycteropus afer afer]
MRFTSTSLLLLLLAISTSPVQGFLEANYTTLKCNCMQETSSFIPFHLIQRFQIFPPGSGCPNVEVIIWLKTNTIICLNPRAKWFQKFLKGLQREHGSLISPTPGLKKRRIA